MTFHLIPVGPVSDDSSFSSFFLLIVLLPEFFIKKLQFVAYGFRCSKLL